MPSTPFHLPPTALVGWPLRERLDLPSMLLTNLVIDVEPVVGGALGLDPPHAFAHTLLGGAAVGALTGWVVWRARARIGSLLGGEYPLRLRTAAISGASGGVLHVLLDAVMYDHLRPFFPSDRNPLYVAGSGDALHLLGALALVPALVMLRRARAWRTVPQKLTAGLLALSGVAMAVAAAIGRV